MLRSCAIWKIALLITFTCAMPTLADDADSPLVKRVRGTWKVAPSMLHARAAHAVVSTGKAIYALAGTGEKDGSPVLDVERFDGKKWTDETRLPGSGLNAPAAVAVGGRIYLIGGFLTVTNLPTAETHIYHPAKREWTQAAPMPAPRGGHAAVVLHGLIHVIGGGNSQSTLADHMVFDPATKVWSIRTPLPRAMGGPAAAVFEGKIYSIGGRSGPSDFEDVYIFDPTTDKWTTGPSIAARATSGAVAFHQAIYLFGGESQAKSTVLADTLCLSKGSAKWVTAVSMPTSRSFARAVLFRDSVYVVGGSPVPQMSHAPVGLATVERFQLPRTGPKRSK